MHLFEENKHKVSQNETADLPSLFLQPVTDLS